MPDLAVLVPTRGRPRNVARLIAACAKTCRTNTILHFGLDDDDPTAATVLAHIGPDIARTRGPRLSLTGWTNKLAAEHPGIPYLASIGDDMVPVTDGWDEQLITAIEHMGGGFAYPEDLRRNDIPEAVVMSAEIAVALGGMCPVRGDGRPVVAHWFVDCMWSDLGNAAGCIRYLPEVVVEHRHPNMLGQEVWKGDQTYWDAAQSYDEDLAAYQWWRMRDMPAAVKAVREVIRRDAVG